MKFLSDEHLASLGSRLGKIGITPNRLSFLGLIFIFIAAWLLYLEIILPSLLFILLGGCADALDGIVARSTRQATLRGGFLDSMIDRYSDTLLIGAMLLGGWLETLSPGDWELELISNISGEAWALGALSGALLTSYARAASERLGVKQEGIGLVERPERMAILFLFLAVGQVTIALVLLTVLGHVTVLQRCLYFWRNAPETQNGSQEMDRER